MNLRRWILVVLLIAILGTLMITNPRKGEYIEWAMEKSRPDSGHFLSRVIRPEVAPMYLDGATQQRNYMLFSIFTTDTEAGDAIVTVGICRQFILIKGYGVLKE
jgi:hypothetical protein